MRLSRVDGDDRHAEFAQTQSNPRGHATRSDHDALSRAIALQSCGDRLGVLDGMLAQAFLLAAASRMAWLS